MVREYFDNKLKNIDENIKVKQQEYDKNCDLEQILKKDIFKIQEESDINFEVFYPRSGSNSRRGKMNELCERLNKVEIEKLELRETLDFLKEKRNKYQLMLNEIIELVNRSNNK